MTDFSSVQKFFGFETLYSNSQNFRFFFDLFNNLDTSNISFNYNKTGRPSISKIALIKTAIVKNIKGFEHISQLITFLRDNPAILYLCGLQKMPSDTTFYDFFTYSGQKLIDQIFQNNVKLLIKHEIVDCKEIIIDSTPMETNSPINNKKSFSAKHYPKNNDTNSHNFFKFGVHTASNSGYNKNKTNYYFGCKDHILVDCKYGIPIANITTPANVHDSKVAMPLFHESNLYIDFQKHSKFLIADKGYDDSAIYDDLKAFFDIMLIAPIKGNKAQKPLISKIQYCDAGFRMHSCGAVYTKTSVRHKFACPLAKSKTGTCPINHEKFFNKAANKGCIRWFSSKKPTLRNLIDRKSQVFKNLYKKRIKIEQYNSRFKNSGNKKIYLKSQNAVEISNKISHITAQLVALLAFKREKPEYVRSLAKLLKVS